MEFYVKILIKSSILIGLTASLLHAQMHDVVLEEPSIVQKSLHRNGVDFTKISKTDTIPFFDDPKIMQSYQIPNKNKKAFNNIFFMDSMLIKLI